MSALTIRQLEPETVEVRRSYFDQSPIEGRYDELVFTEYHHTTSDICLGLIRAGYRIDVLLEPETKVSTAIPQLLVLRARKEA